MYHSFFSAILLRIILPLLGFFSLVFAQADTSLVLNYLEKGEKLEGSKPDSAIFWERKALNLSQKIRYNKGEAEAYYYLAWANINAGRYENALSALDTAIFLYKKQKNALELPKLYNGKAAAYQHLGDYDKAVSAYLSGLQALESLPQKDKNPKIQKNIAKMRFNVAAAFKLTRNFKASETYLKQASDFYLQQKDTASYLDCLNNLGSLYGVQKDSLQEFAYIEQSFALLKQFPAAHIRTKEVILLNYGTMLRRKGNLKEALEYMEEAHILAQKSGAFYSAQSAYILGNTYLELKNISAAEKSAQEIFAYAHTSRSHRAYADAYELSTKISEAKGEYAQALISLREYKRYGDSLSHTEHQKGVALLERQFDTAKKDKQLAENQLQIEQQKRWIFTAAGIVLLLGLGFIFLFQNNKRKRKAQEAALLQLRQEQEIKAMKALITGEENERSRVAKELHDSVGGLLATVRLHFDAIRMRDALLQENKDYQYALSLLDNANSYVRQISHHLMPEVLTQYHLQKALENYCEAINRSQVLQISFQTFGMEENTQFPAGFELMVYRIIQELLTNIIKHAQATEAILQINKHENSLSITVEDNGKGFDSQLLSANKGMGLSGIQSKIAYLGGKMEIESSPNAGTSIFITLNLDAPSPQYD